MTPTLIVIAVIGISAIMMLILCAGMMAFGQLIAKTPDGQEMRGERVREDIDKKVWSSPENMPKYFSVGLSVIFIIGCIVLLLGENSTATYIFGGMTVFVAIFFAAGFAAHELLIYNQMVANLKEHKEYIKVINS
jgi:hypothetical protein